MSCTISKLHYQKQFENEQIFKLHYTNQLENN